MSKLGFAWDYPSGDCRITDDLGGVHMATLYEMKLIGEVDQLQSKLGEARLLIVQARAGLNHVGVVENIDQWTAAADQFLEPR